MQVMIGDMSPLLRSLVIGILGENPDLHLLGEEEWRWSFSEAIAAPVLLLYEGAACPSLPAIGSGPGDARLGMVAIAADGHEATVVRLTAHRLRLEGDPRHGLSGAIQWAAGIPRPLQ